MIHFHCLRSLALALAGLAILSVAEPLRAENATTRKFEGLVIVPLPAVLNDDNYGSNKDLTFEITNRYGWESKVSPLGRVSGAVTINIDSLRLSHTCKMTLVDRGGNQVHLTYKVSRPSTASQYQPDTFTIDGGTNKFAGATGGGTVRHMQFALASSGGSNYIQIYFSDARISY